MRDYTTFNFKDTNKTLENIEFFAISAIQDAVEQTDYQFFDIEAGGFLGLAPYF